VLIVPRRFHEHPAHQGIAGARDAPPSRGCPSGC
jgi:hypothetical protein